MPAYYLPRTEFADEITAALADAQKPVIAITGVEGVGKTTLASAVAERYPDAVLWGDFQGQIGELRDVLGSFLAALNIDTDEFVSQQDRIKVLRSALADRAILIVLDNLSDQDFDPSSLLPAVGRSHILLTTPDRDFAADVGTYVANLSPCPPDMARKILVNIAGEEILSLPKDLLSSLLEQTGGLAAFLVTAALQARRLKRRGVAALEEWAANPDIKWNDLSSLYEFSVSQLSEAEQQVLAVVGMLASTPFSPQLVAGTLDIDLRLARRYIDALERRSFLTALPDGRFRVHEAVRKYARDRFSDCSWHSAVCRQLTHRLFEWAGQVVSDNAEYAQRLDHLGSVFDVCLQIADWDLARSISSLSFRPHGMEGSVRALYKTRTFLGQFDGVNFHSATVIESNLSGSQFDGADFYGASLVAVQAAGAHFDGCNFRDAHFCRADLRATRFDGCNFDGVQMIQTDLRGAQFVGCDFADNFVIIDPKWKPIQFIACNGIESLASSSLNTSLASFGDARKKVLLPG